MNTPTSALSARRRQNLRRLLKPRHVAFVGGRSVEGAIRQCIESGFAGEIWPVSLKEESLAGLRCFRTVEELPAGPDAAFVAVPREVTVDIVRRLAARGSGGCVCYAAGFAEIGGEGVGLQEELAAAAGDLALLGPNCYGLLNYVDGVALWPVGHGGSRVKRGVAMIGQSGNIALNLTSNQRSLPLSYIVSLGNQAVLGFADLVEALVQDAAIAAIGLYLEGLTDVPAFVAAAAKAIERGVPIVALKAGRSDLGARLALSHTSSLAGDDALYDVLFERLGIVRARSLSGMLEALKLLAVAGPLPGERLMVFTCSGGDGLMTADLAAELGLALPPLAAKAAAAIRAQLPDFASVSNPLDYNTKLWGDRDSLVRCFETALAGDYDLGMLVIDYPERDAQMQRECDIAVDALIEAGRRTRRRVAVASTLAELLPPAARERMVAGGAPPLQGIEDAVAAVKAGAAYAAARRRIRDVASVAIPRLAPVRGESRLLEEAEAKRRLAACGLRIPEGRVVSAGEAASAAASLGFPVVAKVARPVLAHKTEAGAVALGLGSAAEVEVAVAAMTRSLAERGSGAVAERFLVERQVEGALAELIVGVRRDAQFGLALVIGAGGVLVEMARDTATLLLPTDRAAIERALAGLRVVRLFEGYRGRPRADAAAVVDAVLAVAAFAEGNRERLVELDINPLLVLPEGEGAVAVDALVVMGEG